MPASPCGRCGTPHTTAGGLRPDCRAKRNVIRNATETQRRGSRHQRGRGSQHAGARSKA